MVPGPKVSVVIGNWNRLEDLKRAVESVRRQTYSNVEIIVVDNNSSDGSIEWCRQQADIWLLVMRCDLGASAMLDTGFMSGSGKYVVCMDNDAVLDMDFIEQGVFMFENVYEYYAHTDEETLSLIEEGYKLGCITPIMRRPDGGFDMKPGQWKLDKVQAGIQFHGASCMFSKEAGDAVGWYNPEYYLYHNEVDFGARLFKAKYLTVLNPQVGATHCVSPAGRVRPRLLYYGMRHYYWFIWEHLPLHLAIYHTFVWMAWCLLSSWRYPKTLIMAHVSALARMPWFLMRRKAIHDPRVIWQWYPNFKKELNPRRIWELFRGEKEQFGVKKT